MQKALAAFQPVKGCSEIMCDTEMVSVVPTVSLIPASLTSCEQLAVQSMSQCSVVLILRLTSPPNATTDPN